MRLMVSAGDSITIVYVGGYELDNMPADIRSAVGVIARAINDLSPNRRESQVLKNLVAWEYPEVQRAMPMAAKTLLDTHRLIEV